MSKDNAAEVDVQREFISICREEGILAIAQNCELVASEPSSYEDTNQSQERSSQELNTSAVDELHNNDQPPIPPSTDQIALPGSLATPASVLDQNGSVLMGLKRSTSMNTIEQSRKIARSNESERIANPLRASDSAAGLSASISPASLSSKGPKGGLRLFSGQVLEKVKQKGTTTYNEVADELVAEMNEQLATDGTAESNQKVDHKNIRRRVYDALNVLRAMRIISKQKKEITWVGLPTGSCADMMDLEAKKRTLSERVRKKMEMLREMVRQYHAYQALLSRNDNCGARRHPAEKRIALPFILVNTPANSVIQCEMSDDKTDYIFNFSDPFEMHDDTQILAMMGLYPSTSQEEKAMAEFISSSFHAIE